jgi:LCP family protein required for cell wall assembly
VNKGPSTRFIKITTGISLAIVAISAITWIGLGQLFGSIHTFDAFAGISKRPTKASSALNFLIVGSDSRAGLSDADAKRLAVGTSKTAAGARSDTMFIVHISKDRTKAVLISIPRDTLVVVPAHTASDGKTQVAAIHAKINAAFAWGGAPLLIQTLEERTNLHIDHYVEINFVGFTNIVNALGGIEVCSKVNINDPKSHLVMSAGVHQLDGIEALKYVRTRDFDGLGDIGRMQRQQQFMASVLRKATSAGVLLNPVKLLSFFKAAISTVKTDSGLSQNDLLTLGQQMGKLSANKVRTLTVPLSNSNGSYPGLGSVVIWDEVKAPELFNRLINDVPIYDVASPSPTAKATSKKGAKATPKPTIIEKFKVRTAAENPCGQVNY